LTELLNNQLFKPI